MAIWASLLLQVAAATPQNSTESKFPPECSLAVAASIKQIEKERNSEQNAWEFVKSKFRVTRCNRNGKFVNVEFLLRDDPYMFDGEMYFRVNIDDGNIVERNGMH